MSIQHARVRCGQMKQSLLLIAYYQGLGPGPRALSGGFQNLAGQVGSCQEVLELSRFDSPFTGRVESGRVGRFSNLMGRDPIRPVKSESTRQKSCLIRLIQSTPLRSFHKCKYFEVFDDMNQWSVLFP